MKVSRQRVAENRANILSAASRLFRERGFADVTVAEVMEAAGLTHGAFYGYFTSKDELITEALKHVSATMGKTSEGDLVRFVKSYLSPVHRDNVADGCPTAALGAETARQSKATRAAATEDLRRQLERLSRGAPGDKPSAKRRHAIGSWSAMVGALILSRLSDDLQLSDEVLRETLAFVKGRE